ncbi:MAG: Na+/H+ antiporter subunit E [Methanophagales archaeon]|nr:Na+/H+ antiporter subunit E [Methanophagales archaeon]
MANFDVAYCVLPPKMPIDPRIIEFDTSLRSDFAPADALLVDKTKRSAMTKILRIVRQSAIPTSPSLCACINIAGEFMAESAQVDFLSM